MKITARASGGLAGRTETFELDTSCAANGRSVEELVKNLKRPRKVMLMVKAGPR